MEMQVYGLADGLICWLLRDGVDQMPREPGEPTSTFEFDDETNGALAAALIADPYQYRLLAGTLYQNGQAVAIVAPGTAYSERKAVLALAQALRDFNALDPATLTTAQKFTELWKAQKANNRLTLVLARLLLSEVQN